MKWTKWALTAAIGITLIARTASATTYELPDDYQVVCLRASTGKPVFRFSPKRLSRPRLRVFGDRLVIDNPRVRSIDVLDPMTELPHRAGSPKFVLDFRSGRQLGGDSLEAPAGEPDAARARPPRNLVDATGRQERSTPMTCESGV